MAAPLLLAVPFVEFFTLPLRESDTLVATRDLVAFVVEDRPLPGFGEPQFDKGLMRRMHHLFVVCDYLPADVSISRDPRVKRITQAESNAVFKKHGYNATSYIHINLKSESSMLLTFELWNSFGTEGAYSYRFEFRRKVWGLRARGKLGPVS
jgi:hypothetical protein